MKPKKILIDYARKSGRMDRVNQLLSLAYTLHSKAFLLYDEADEIMKECGLCLGQLKALSTQLSTLYDRYFKNFSELIVENSEKQRYFNDLQELSEIVHKWAKAPEKWEAKEITDESNDDSNKAVKS